jgi:cytochrome c peroxidase
MGGGPPRHGSRIPQHRSLHLPGLLSYPAPNTKLYAVMGDPKDVGKVKAPTLRNIAVTALRMHDGGVATLDAVIDHYTAGGRTIATGPEAGVGSDNPTSVPRCAASR